MLLTQTDRDLQRREHLVRMPVVGDQVVSQPLVQADQGVVVGGVAEPLDRSLRHRERLGQSVAIFAGPLSRLVETQLGAEGVDAGLGELLRGHRLGQLEGLTPQSRRRHPPVVAIG